MNLRKIILDRLEELQLGTVAAATKFGLPRDSLRWIKRNNDHSPRFDRAVEICQALGLKLTITSPDGDQYDSQPMQYRSGLLENVIIAVESYLSQHKLTLNPYAKADLVSKLYIAHYGLASVNVQLVRNFIMGGFDGKQRP